LQAVLPPGFKLSGSLDPVIQASQKKRKQAAKDSLPVKHLPAELSHLEAVVGSDGTALLKLKVLGLPLAGADKQALQKSAKQQALALQDALMLALQLPGCSSSSSNPCCPIVSPIGVTGSFEVLVCLVDAAAAATALSELSGVQWVGVTCKKQSLNIMAGTAMQLGDIPQPLVDVRMQASMRPLWEAGLDGSGQLIAIADTGIYMDRRVSKYAVHRVCPSPVLTPA
jgi:hypothetical protein